MPYEVASSDCYLLMVYPTAQIIIDPLAAIQNAGKSSETEKTPISEVYGPQVPSLCSPANTFSQMEFQTSGKSSSISRYSPTTRFCSNYNLLRWSNSRFSPNVFYSIGAIALDLPESCDIVRSPA